jgi:hypothetical protein
MLLPTSVKILPGLEGKGHEPFLSTLLLTQQILPLGEQGSRGHSGLGVQEFGGNSIIKEQSHFFLHVPTKP